MFRNFHAQKVGEHDWVFARRRVEEIFDAFDRRANSLGLPQTPTSSTIATHLRLAITLFDGSNIDRGTVHEGVLQVLATRWVAMTDISIGPNEIRRMSELIREHGFAWRRATDVLNKLATRCERNKRSRTHVRRDLHVLGWAMLLSQSVEWCQGDEGRKAFKDLGQLLAEFSL